MQSDMEGQVRERASMSRAAGHLSQKKLQVRRARQRQYDRLRIRKEAEAIEKLRAMLPDKAQKQTKLETLRSAIDRIKSLIAEVEKMQSGNSECNQGSYCPAYQSDYGDFTSIPIIHMSSTDQDIIPGLL